MKLSIITVCYNSAGTITDTIESVRGQSYSDIEYIVVDGGSTDGTLDILNAYKDDITTIVSEPDNGLYDAMNKGIRLATGDIIGILNSDDFYANNTVVSDIINKIKETNSDIGYGDLLYVDRETATKTTRFWKPGKFNSKKINYGWIPPHPTLFVTKEAYKKFGLYNTDFKIAADYEFMLRCLKKNNATITYLPKTIVKMREGGMSSKNIFQRIKGWKELRKAWKINNLKVPFLFSISRPIFKISQYEIMK